MWHLPVVIFKGNTRSTEIEIDTVPHSTELRELRLTLFAAGR